MCSAVLCFTVISVSFYHTVPLSHWQSLHDRYLAFPILSFLCLMFAISCMCVLFILTPPDIPNIDYPSLMLPAYSRTHATV